MTAIDFDRAHIWHPYASLKDPPPVRQARAAKDGHIVKVIPDQNGDVERSGHRRVEQERGAERHLDPHVVMPAFAAHVHLVDLHLVAT